MPYTKPSTTNPVNTSSGRSSGLFTNGTWFATRRNNKQAIANPSVRSSGLNVRRSARYRIDSVLEKFLAIGYHGVVTESPTRTKNTVKWSATSGRTAQAPRTMRSTAAATEIPPGALRQASAVNTAPSISIAT